MNVRVLGGRVPQRRDVAGGGGADPHQQQAAAEGGGRGAAGAGHGAARGRRHQPAGPGQPRYKSTKRYLRLRPHYGFFPHAASPPEMHTLPLKTATISIVWRCMSREYVLF